MEAITFLGKVSSLLLNRMSALLGELLFFAFDELLRTNGKKALCSSWEEEGKGK